LENIADIEENLTALEKKFIELEDKMNEIIKPLKSDNISMIGSIFGGTVSFCVHNKIIDDTLGVCKNRSNLDTNNGNTWTPLSVLFGH